ncbi:MAG: Hsp70 family protein, partial [Acidiferrobacterales bacterium]|nr:Hsp70 family protein [Acidiferrobacterales bacterium]
SSGLNEDEIERMVKDAEAHAEEDKRARELAEARNQADGMIHGVRKSMKDLGDKLDSAEKEKIEAAIKDLEAVIKGDDKAAIENKTQALAEGSHKLAEQLYAQAQQAGEQPTAEASASNGQPKDENVVDAEFEEVKENKGKK